MRATALLLFFNLWAVTESVVIPAFDTSNISEVLIPNVLSRAAADPTDFSWVKRWAAVGDSFTAGIGAGAPLSDAWQEFGDENYYCSRYDKSYPMIVNDALGSSVESFQFRACSGDRTGGIYKQIQDMNGKLDLVIMTAGGNDLCLSSMILKCVFSAYDGEEACTSVITLAQKNLDTILKPNLKMLMDALNSKMNTDSVVVFNGYAQFFNTENEDCATDQDWTVYNIFGHDSLTLTVARRKQFNNLVVQINDVIRTVVEETAANSTYKFEIGFSNWDAWPSGGVRGQYCDPSSTGRYPDTMQPDLQFFKRDTHVDKTTVKSSRRAPSIDLGKRDEVAKKLHRDNVQDELYNSLLYKSSSPQAEVKHKLDRRAPSLPNCPGDDKPEVFGVPNYLGRNFHPNVLGHYTIASWSLQTIMDLRANVLGVVPPSCPVVDKFSCWQKFSTKNYASSDRLNESYKDFCEDVDFTTEDDLSVWEKHYDVGTPGVHFFRIRQPSTATFDKAKCLSSMERIINGCDGNDPKNPMNWKFGGEWIQGDITYQVVPYGTRPWPLMQKSGGRCSGWYKGGASYYDMEGFGFSDWDFGGKTLHPEIRDCIGSDPSEWKFEYYDKPTDKGYEWKASFHTPIWVRRRCFQNNKVVSNIGGWTDGCAGND